MLKSIKKFIKWYIDWKTWDYVFFLVIIIIFLIAGWFYWFQWQPAEIRKECAEVKEKYIEEIKRKGYSITKSVPAIEVKYETCLNKKGLR